MLKITSTLDSKFKPFSITLSFEKEQDVEYLVDEIDNLRCLGEDAPNLERIKDALKKGL